MYERLRYNLRQEIGKHAPETQRLVKPESLQFGARGQTFKYSLTSLKFILKLPQN